MLSDREIVGRVRKGKTRHFAKLIERYQRSVFAVAYRILGSRDDAEDAAQDAFICAYRSLNTYSDDLALWPWLRRIAVNCSLKRLPREIPTEHVVELADSEAPALDPVEAEAFRNCESDTIRKAVVGLPANYRTVVVLRYLEDMRSDEIGKVLDLNAVTVRVRLHRALKMLAERLAVVRNEV